jgi:hypothetical protein
VAVFLFDANTGKQLGQSYVFYASAPTNESTILLPVMAADMGINPAKARFTYGAQGYDGFTGNFDFLGETLTGAVAPDAAKFNAYANAISTGGYAALAPLGVASVPLSINTAELPLSKPLGVMVVNMENASGAKEASLLRLGGSDEEDDD